MKLWSLQLPEAGDWLSARIAAPDREQALLLLAEALGESVPASTIAQYAGEIALERPTVVALRRRLTDR